MTTSVIARIGFAHYADAIGAPHESCRAIQAFLRRQFTVTLAVLVVLGGVLAVLS